MLCYIIFILIFNVLTFQAHDFDIYEISDRKPVVNNNLNSEIFQKVRKRENTDSVEKDIRTKESVTLPNLITKNQTVSNKSRDDKAVVNSDGKLKNTEENGSNLVKSKNRNEETPNKISEESLKNATESIFKHSKHPTTEHPGAVWRGFYVFLGLSFLIIIYFIFKAFRLRPGAPPPATVRKYGIVGRRSDMEMLPLPLAEDEDDDTLFDMGTQVNR